MTLIDLFTICYVYAHDPSGTINRVIGDISFVQEFGENPGNTTNEQLRIKTHLRYVEMLLWQKDVSALTSAQLENRWTVLTHLHQYWVKRQFPT